MTDDPQNLGPFLASLGARRIGVEHYTEHDFEMERIAREESQRVYAKRLEQLETAGWVSFRHPFYYARREFHGGHYIPGTRKRVPTGVAFAMFREANPDVELEPRRPHPHGWRPPVAPEDSPHLFKMGPIKVEPMKMPAGKFLTMKCEYGTPEDRRERRERRERWETFCSQFEGVRYTSGGSTRDPETGTGRPAVFVTLEHDEDADNFPEMWEDRVVRVEVKSEADEKAEEEAKRKAEQTHYEEEAAWLRKARMR